jgi:AMP-polyphosphate phosphotransferase
MEGFMLEQIDLSKEVSKADYNSTISQLEIKLGELQRQARTLGIPVIIVFEGWDAAGKGTMINQLLLAMDPRGFSVYLTKAANEEERFRPFLWRFWTRTPEKGRIAIFDHSWYGRVLEERIEKIVSKKQWQSAYHEISTFEKQLAVDGTVIIKFFLHIDKKEQKKRFKKLLKNPATSWKVTEADWKQHKQYQHYVTAIEEMLYKTNNDIAPWIVVESHDRRYATLKVFNTVIDALERRISQLEKSKAVVAPVSAAIEPHQTVLDTIDLSPSLSREEYEQVLKKMQHHLMELEHEIYIRRVPVIVVFQGWDAAGKGGAIKRLVEGLDPRGYEVVPVGPPNDVEKLHHYLWRFWMRIPKAGHIAIFDRSWYGRLMVERIDGFCTEAEWRRAFSEINEFEEHLASYGSVIVKFWLQIDSEEQLRRFKERETTPYKQWKISEVDWHNRNLWDQYAVAVDDMLRQTSTPFAPWTIVEANCKLFARIKVLKTVIESIETQLNKK